MSHWFDDMAKGLARGGILPRRSFMQLVAMVSGSSLVAQVPFVGRAFAQAGACPFRRTGNTVVHEMTVSRSGLTLHRQMSYDLAQQTGTINATLTRGSTPVATINMTVTRGAAARGTITYGPDIRGARTATARTIDGKVIEGDIDGRAFTWRNGQSTFSDGLAPPKIDADQGVIAAITDVVSEAAPSIAACRSTRPRPGGTPRRRVIGSMSAPGGDWYEPASENSPDCSACQNDCGTTYANEVKNFFCFIALPCQLSALAEWGGCLGLCQLPGHPCRPNPCGTFSTCSKGDTCFSYQGGDLCCTAPAAVCQGVCCGTDITSCAPNGACGCTSDETLCGGNQCCDNAKETCANGICCPKGQVNHNGKCCDPKAICGSVCCDQLATCADAKNSLCCQFTAPVCGGKCCKPGGAEVCVNGQCCPSERSCNGVCCPAGQHCTDPYKKTCSACPANQVPCLPDKGASICCPPNVACCPGGPCCKPGESCNLVGPNKYACGPRQQIR